MTFCGGKVTCHEELLCQISLAVTDDDGDDGNDGDDNDDNDKNMTRILPMIVKITTAMKWNKHDDNTGDSNANSIGDD